MPTKPICPMMIVAVLLAGCAGGGGNGNTVLVAGKNNGKDSKAPAITLSALGLAGALDEAATVEVNALADQDGAMDNLFLVEIDLGTNGLPPEPNGNNTASGLLVMEATDAAGNVGSEQVEVDF